MYTEQRSAGSIEELRKYIGDKYATKRRFGEIDSHPIYCKGRYLYDVHRIFRFLDSLPPCHCHKSADFVPFTCFLGTPLPTHQLRTSYMEGP